MLPVTVIEPLTIDNQNGQSNKLLVTWTNVDTGVSEKLTVDVIEDEGADCVNSVDYSINACRVSDHRPAAVPGQSQSWYIFYTIDTSSFTAEANAEYELVLRVEDAIGDLSQSLTYMATCM